MRHSEQNVTLILVVIDAAQELRLAVGAALDAGVVPGRDIVRIELAGVIMQAAKLQPVVATHARIRRAPGVVLVDEVLNDPSEVAFEVADVERQSELPRHLTRIGGVIDRTASLFPDAHARLTRFVIFDQAFYRFTGRSQSHETPDNVIAFFEQQQSRNRRVNPARHGEQYSSSRRHRGIVSDWILASRNPSAGGPESTRLDADPVHHIAQFTERNQRGTLTVQIA